MYREHNKDCCCCCWISNNLSPSKSQSSTLQGKKRTTGAPLKEECMSNITSSYKTVGAASQLSTAIFQSSGRKPAQASDPSLALGQVFYWLSIHHRLHHHKRDSGAWSPRQRTRDDILGMPRRKTKQTNKKWSLKLREYKSNAQPVNRFLLAAFKSFRTMLAYPVVLKVLLVCYLLRV